MSLPPSDLVPLVDKLVHVFRSLRGGSGGSPALGPFPSYFIGYLVVIEFLFLFSPIWVKMAQFTTLPKIRVGFSGTSRAHMLRDGAGLAKGFGDL